MIPQHDIENPIGQSGLAESSRQLDRRQRSQFAGLEDHRVAGRQRGSRFPAGNLQRIVPGSNTAHDTQRLTQCVGEILPQVMCRPDVAAIPAKYSSASAAD